MRSREEEKLLRQLQSADPKDLPPVPPPPAGWGMLDGQGPPATPPEPRPADEGGERDRMGDTNEILRQLLQEATDISGKLDEIIDELRGGAG